MLSNLKSKKIVQYIESLYSAGESELFCIDCENESSEILSALQRMKERIDYFSEQNNMREERLKYALEGSNTGYWDWNIDKEEVFISDDVSVLFENTSIKLDKSIIDLNKYIYFEDRITFIDAIESCLELKDKSIKVEFRISDSNGNFKWAIMKGKVIEKKDDVPARIAGIVFDITDRKLLEEKLTYQSFYDTLTGLYNREYFEIALNNLNVYGPFPYSIIFGDMNGLKVTNDAFGHHEGDRLLDSISRILKECCRNGDIISRWGGDEFAIILNNANEQIATKVCNRIKEVCKTTTECVVQPSIALGVVTRYMPVQDIIMVVNEAEVKMYKNKLVDGKRVRNDIIKALGKKLALKSHESEEHIKRSKALAIKFGRYLELNENDVEKLGLLASIHDIGKIAIPEIILMKPGKLSLSEWNIVKQHSEIGYRIANSTPEISQIAEGILTHHEYYDGSGYPNGLKGDQIPPTSRIFSIIDAYEIMTHTMPYKIEVKEEDAIIELEKNAGRQFDPHYVRLFSKMINSEGNNIEKGELKIG